MSLISPARPVCGSRPVLSGAAKIVIRQAPARGAEGSQSPHRSVHTACAPTSPAMLAGVVRSRQGSWPRRSSLGRLLLDDDQCVCEAVTLAEAAPASKAAHVSPGRLFQ